MTYTVTKTINGNNYLYRQESYRVEGEKNPRTRSTYLGRADGASKRKPKKVAKSITSIPDKTSKVKTTFLEKLKNPSPRAKKVLGAVGATVSFLGREFIDPARLSIARPNKKIKGQVRKTRKAKPTRKPRINVATSNRGLANAVKAGIKQGIKEGIAEARASKKE